MPSTVTHVPAAAPADALAHFERRLAFETDCADVHAALLEARTSGTEPDFVLLDVRGAGAYARGHVPGAWHLPHRDITIDRLAAWPEDTVFVAYCAGPHCNGADKGAARIAALGRSVKLMLGGVVGWRDEGFAFATGRERGAIG